jgi:hypothetical protein
MKSLLVTLAAMILFLLSCFPNTGFAEEQMKFWPNMCASCHDGKTAPNAAQLKEKYKTAEAFGKAVRHMGSRCMNILKNDKKLAAKVAAELGLR